MINLASSKPFWLLYYFDHDMDEIGSFTFEEGSDPGFEVFESESAAHTQAQEYLGSGAWKHAIVLCARGLGSFSQETTYTSFDGVPVKAKAVGHKPGRRMLEMNE